MLAGLDGHGWKQFAGTFAAGIVAGVLLVILDQFLVSKVEAAVGLTPSAA